MNPFAVWLAWSAAWMEWTVQWWQVLLTPPSGEPTLTGEERRRLEALRLRFEQEIADRQSATPENSR